MAVRKVSKKVAGKKTSVVKPAVKTNVSDHNFFLLLLLSVIILGGYIAYTDRIAVERARPTPQPTKSVTVALNELNKSKESGTAVLKEEGGKVTVTLNLTGAAKNVKQTAHIHAGLCPGAGKVMYSLAFPVGGTSSTALDVSLDYLKSKLPLAINVHKLEKDTENYTSCGEIKL